MTVMKPVLSLHAGMPKTGTTALQFALAANEEKLNSSGWIYPAEFRNEEGVAHHRLPAALQSSSPDSTLAKFHDFLKKNAESNILVSSEAFTNSLGPSKVDALVNFLTPATTTHRVVLVLALRRIDDFFQSMYLHSTKVGELSVPFEQYLRERLRWAEGLFAAIARLRESEYIEKVTLEKYDRSSNFLDRLLSAAELNVEARTLISSIKKQNTSLGLKAQVALLHYASLSTQYDFTMKRAALIRDMESGAFQFADDLRNYSIITPWQARAIHENALRFSLEYDIQEYYDAFSNDKIDEKAPANLDASLLDAADIRLLAEHCRS